MMKFQKGHKKLAAFTLMELMVGMVVSLIVGAAALMAYMLLFKQFANYREESSKLERMYELGSMLREDVYRSQWMEKRGDVLLLNFPTYEVQYSFDKEEIIRTVPWRKDTFEIRITNYVMQFEGEELYSDAKVDRLFLIQENNETPLRSVYKKDYAADVLLKLEKK